MEKWIVIKGFERYEISNKGNVRNVLSGKALKPSLNTGGYQYVTLCCSRHRKNKTIHRLVAEAFIQNPLNLPEVNHKDENKENNNVSNLEWVTKKENMNYGTRTERANQKKYKAVYQCAKNGEEVRKFESLKEAEKEGFNHSAISECCYGKRKTHGGYKWRF